MSIYDVIDTTWPAAQMRRVGPWMQRITHGAGSRVSAISAAGDWADADIAQAEDAARAEGLTPLFILRDGDNALDFALSARGYKVKDPVNIYATDVAPLTKERMPYAQAFAIWPMLAIMDDIWDSAGIGPMRRDVMARCALPKAGVLGRVNDRAAGCAFVALDGETAMLHAVEVIPELRRLGCAERMIRAAAHWTRENGGKRLTLLTTRENTPANATWTSAGMGIVGHYHYRIHPEAT